MRYCTGYLFAGLALTVALAAACPGSVISIGGPGSISTSDGTSGSLALLDKGEQATALYEYAIASSDGEVTLTFVVTNTSPAVVGSESEGQADAPCISDIFFSVPSGVTGMTFRTADGVNAAVSGWEFTFDPDAEPDKGFGFLMSRFDSWLDGGPPGSPAPVIGSLYDPDITDEPGSPVASPCAFVFTLAFGGGMPAGLSDDWFVDASMLGDPAYIAAAKFMGGANGGSGTVTDRDTPPTPVPASLTLAVLGLAAAAAARRRTKASRDSRACT